MTIKERKKGIQRVLEIEGAGGDERFADLILAYCDMVEWGEKAIDPILQNDPKFMTDLENMGALMFNIHKAVVDNLKKQTDILETMLLPVMKEKDNIEDIDSILKKNKVNLDELIP